LFGDLLQRYKGLLQAGTYLPDPQQLKAVEALNSLYHGVLEHRRGWRRLLGRPLPTPKGIYLYGGVGRGKTLMMDLFFDALPLARKQRLHFHRFMARVHEALRERPSTSDPLPRIADEWAERCRILCFDEFHVSDIADAMLLGGLLEALVERGVILVATSNVAPGELYLDGLQRKRFLPAIELLQRHTRVHHVGGGLDYRLRLLERAEIYHCPLDREAEASLEKNFRSMAGESEDDRHMVINKRPFTARRRADGVIWFDFAELCLAPRSVADYIEIARTFNTVLLSGIPVMGRDDADGVRRFIELVDEFYDRNVKLLLAAAAPAESLYTGASLGFEFKRTVSRLAEMQSHDYLARPHLP